jgi:hypothetical protein
MKYRVRLDLSFATEADARALVAYAKTLVAKASNINEKGINAEISNIDIHLCGHDQGKPCQPIETVKVAVAAIVK